MLDLYYEIHRRVCPKCGAEESLDIALPQYRVVCRTCRNYLIDPFQIGPWSEKERILDTFDGDMVSLYLADKREPPPQADLNENWIDFIKYLREREKSHV